jgi:hypothetical protein
MNFKIDKFSYNLYHAKKNVFTLSGATNDETNDDEYYPQEINANEIKSKNDKNKHTGIEDHDEREFNSTNIENVLNENIPINESNEYDFDEVNENRHRKANKQSRKKMDFNENSYENKEHVYDKRNHYDENSQRNNKKFIEDDEDIDKDPKGKNDLNGFETNEKTKKTKNRKGKEYVIV